MKLREETVQNVLQNRSEDSFASGLRLFSGISSSFDVTANQEIAEILRKKKKAKRTSVAWDYNDLFINLKD